MSSIHFPRLRRRSTAFLLSVLCPGLGHYSLGDSSRALAIYGASFTLLSLSVFAVAYGASRLFLGALLLSVLLSLLAALATLPARLGPSPGKLRILAWGATGYGLTALLALVSRGTLFDSYSLPTGSMSPNLLIFDRIFATKINYRPERGQVVVYRSPGGQLYAKRIVALGGDTIGFRGNEVILNGTPLRHLPSSRPCSIDPSCVSMEEFSPPFRYEIIGSPDLAHLDATSEVIPPGHVFLLGDARAWSADSRQIGPVAEDAIVGRVTFVWWPPERYGATPNRP